MKHLWLEDEDKIRIEMNRLIKKQISIICGRRGTRSPIKLTAKGIVSGEDGDLLILSHPHEPTCSSQACHYYYHPEGEQLRYFEAARSKWASKMLALKMPRQIFNVYVRNHERIRGARNSSLSFVVPNKQRILAGKVENISLEGCKIVGSVPAVLKKGEMVNHLTLTLFFRSASRKEYRLHIPEAKVVWAKTNGDQTEACGIHFTLADPTTKKELSEYIDLRLIEDNR